MARYNFIAEGSNKPSNRRCAGERGREVEGSEGWIAASLSRLSTRLYFRFASGYAFPCVASRRDLASYRFCVIENAASSFRYKFLLDSFKCQKSKSAAEAGIKVDRLGSWLLWNYIRVYSREVH